MANVTITLSAEYAARAAADLKALREGDPAMTRYTPAVSVVLRRLEDALSALAPVPAPVGGGALTGDVTDPAETQDAPAPMVIVTRVADLDPEARYALWVCDAYVARPGARHGDCNGHSIHATGTGAEIAPAMGVYEHCYAELLAETQDAPATGGIVTRVDDLDPRARYTLWVCNAEMRRPGVLHNACYGHSIYVAGTGAEISGPMGLYMHAYAERLND